MNEEPKKKLTAVTLNFQGKTYQGFVWTVDGHLTDKQLSKICPLWADPDYRGCTFSLG